MLTDSPVERFRRQLLAGEPPPGAFVTLREIATALDIPLAKARETAQRLELEGFVQIHAQRGVQVRDITVRSTRAAFGFRSIMEEAAVLQYAKAASPAELDRLSRITSDLAAIAPGLERADLAARVVDVDWEMHFAMIRSLDNPFLSQAYEVNATHIRWIRSNSVIPAERLHAVLAEHLAILEACRARDPEQALGLLRAHISAALTQALAG